MMAIDKLRAITERRPRQSWFDQMNAELQRPEAERHFIFNFLYRDRADMDRIGISTRVRISTKPKIVPHYMVELNSIAPGGKKPPFTVFETNPNKYEKGWDGVCSQVDEILSPEDVEDLKITRVDLNAEIEVSVQFLRDSLIVSGKRKNAAISKDREDWQNFGTETFYIGRRPSRVRIYDKIQELKYRSQDVTRLPKVLTRVEWELGGVRVPIDKFARLPDLLPECHPFAVIQIKESVPYYDFKTDLKRSIRRKQFDDLIKAYGAHEARRLLNRCYPRHFARDFGEGVVLDNTKVKDALIQSYGRNRSRLLSGRGADITHMFLRCARCNAEGVRPCGGCGVRLCSTCVDLNEGHELTCPERD